MRDGHADAVSRNAGVLYERGARQGEAAYGPDHPHVARDLQIYAAVLRRLKRKDEAKAAAKRADAILSQNASDNPQPHTVYVDALIR